MISPPYITSMCLSPAPGAATPLPRPRTWTASRRLFSCSICCCIVCLCLCVVLFDLLLELLLFICRCLFISLLFFWRPIQPQHTMGFFVACCMFVASSFCGLQPSMAPAAASGSLLAALIASAAMPPRASAACCSRLRSGDAGGAAACRQQLFFSQIQGSSHQQSSHHYSKKGLYEQCKRL